MFGIMFRVYVLEAILCKKSPFCKLTILLLRIVSFDQNIFL
jgi:hypothetical protein